MVSGYQLVQNRCVGRSMTLLPSATATGALANPAGRADTKQKLASIIDGFSSFDSEMKIGTRVRNHAYDPVGRCGGGSLLMSCSFCSSSATEGEGRAEDSRAEDRYLED